jgi:RimJ/RimL family protein N-acetyltransferase
MAQPYQADAWDNRTVWEQLATRLEGRLVVLEPLTRAHEDGLRAAAASAETWTYMRTRDLDEWFAEAYAAAAAGQFAPFAILRKGDPVGSSSYLSFAPEHLRLEIGNTWLAPRAWGTGVNTETKYLLLRHAFETLGCRRVEFKTEATNARSRAALAALPAQFEGVFRKHMVVRDGERRDSAWYSVIDDDWPAVRANLERRIEAISG